MANRKKTLVVGLDAVCWRYLNPLLEAGRVPTLQGLIDQGVSGKLISTMPAWTPVAWASIITGKNPGKHGVFDMMWRYPGSYAFTPTNNHLRLGTPFWEYLNREGFRSGLVNVPFTHPLDPLDGFAVAGFGTPESSQGLTYPRYLANQIEAEFGTFKPVVSAKLFKSSPEIIFKAEREHQAEQVEMASKFSREFDVDVLAINLMLPDHANHYMPDMADVERAICESDKDLGKLIEAFKPDHIMVLSDHGSRRVKGDFLLYAWLRDNGYCVLEERGPAEREAALNWIIKQWIQSRTKMNGSSERALRFLLRTSLPRLPRSLAERFWDSAEGIIPFAREHVKFSEQLDFQKTKVFPGSSYAGLLFINLMGREPDGVVPAEERPALMEKLSASLNQLVNPDNDEPLFTSIYERENIYRGPALKYGPDLILDSYDSPWNILESLKRGARAEAIHDQYFVANSTNYGWHSRDGIFIFSGPDFASGSFLADGHVMDIPATLLRLYGIPIPEDYDGRPMAEVFTPKFLEQNPAHTQPGDNQTEFALDTLYSEQESEQLVEQLRGLGYLE